MKRKRLDDIKLFLEMVPRPPDEIERPVELGDIDQSTSEMSLPFLPLWMVRFQILFVSKLLILSKIATFFLPFFNLSKVIEKQAAPLILAF